MKKNRVFFRVDGSVNIGLGHLVRSIAMAQMLQDDFVINFFCREIPETLEQEIVQLKYGFSKILSEDTFLDGLNGDEIVVLDNYFFDSNYQKKVKSKGCKLICVDDIYDKEFYADLIINVSPNIMENDYRAQPYTRFALGLNYALLRPAFLLKQPGNIASPSKSQMLVCLGGSDIGNKTIETLKFLKDSFKGIVNIVVGISYPFITMLRQYIAEYDMLDSVFIHYNINQYQLADLMRNCGIAICSPSTISIEYLAVSKGLLFLLLTADNQNHWYTYAVSKNIACTFSESNFKSLDELDVNYALREQLFDGGQKERILKLMQ